MKNNLYEIFSDKWIHNGGRTIWIYSDPHFNDAEIRKLRNDGVSDKEQLKRINSRVNKNDTIIFLGDICDLSLIKKVKGYKVLIMGNHEKGASNYKHKWLRHEIFANLDNLEYVYEEKPECKYNEYIDFFGSLMKEYGDYSDKLHHHSYLEDNGLFDEVYEGPVMINDRLILSHEPIEQLPKYMFNIHGHDHCKKFNSPQHLNVCAENINYTPVNLLSLLKNGLLKDIDNIHRVCIDKATKDKRKKELKNIDKKLKQLYNK